MSSRFLSRVTVSINDQSRRVYLQLPRLAHYIYKPKAEFPVFSDLVFRFSSCVLHRQRAANHAHHPQELVWSLQR